MNCKEIPFRDLPTTASNTTKSEKKIIYNRTSKPPIILIVHMKLHKVILHVRLKFMEELVHYSYYLLRTVEQELKVISSQLKLCKL